MKSLNEEISRIKQVMGINPKKKISLGYHDNLIEIFSESVEEEEDNDKKNNRLNVIEKILNNEFTNDANEFYDSFTKSNKHKEMLTDYNVEDFSKMKLFKLDGYDIGYALKKSSTGDYDEIVSVFNNSGVKNIGSHLIQSAIKNGGCYLDHFDGYLSNFYEKHDFEEIERNEFESKYDPEGKFESKYGKQAFIVRKHKNC